MTTARSELDKMETTGEPELRLHPLSWLFELAKVLRQFIVPLLVLLITGRGNRYEFWGLTAVAFIVPYALARYWSFRYRVAENSIHLRSGLIHKTVREIAFTRIQNVTLHQSLLHRLMNVAEVRLETGGSEKEEGKMRVLGFAQAQQLQRIIRSQDSSASHSMLSPKMQTEDQPLLKLSTRDLIKLGLISNKGMILVAAGIGAIMNFDAKLSTALFEKAGKWIWNHSAVFGQHSWLSYAFGAASLFIAFALALRLISMLHAILHYHDFQLSSNAHQLAISRGLLTRFHGSLPRTRIQAWTLQQSWLQRRFKRFNLRVDAAAGKVQHGQAESQWQLAPIADANGINQIVESVLPQQSWPIADWTALHPLAWRRKFKNPALFMLPVTGICVYWFGWYGLLNLLSIPILYMQAKTWAKHAGYSHENGLIAVREGWISQHWRFAEVHKLQTVSIKQSPFDRRYGMATVFCDTVNAGMHEPALAINYLALSDAVHLQHALSKTIAQ